MNKVLLSLVFVVTISLVFGTQDAFAATKTYTGANFGDWNVGANWNPAGVPATNDDVIIDGFTVEIRSAVTVGTTGSITLSPTATNSNIHTHSPGSLTIFGTITMGDSDDDISIRDSSTVTVQCSGLVALADGMIFLGTTSTGLETLVNHGTITGTLAGGQSQINNNIILRDSNSLVQNSGTLPSAILNDNGGTLQTIPTICLEIGGEIIPINTTALLLAGVQSISMWMIPVVVSGAGIGVFVIMRSRK